MDRRDWLMALLDGNQSPSSPLQSMLKAVQ